jgi:hypothetical protein
MKKALILAIALAVLASGTTGVSANNKGNYWLSIPLSVVGPTGDLTDVAEVGWGAGFGLGYWITESWLIDGQFSYHNFGEKKLEDNTKINGATFPIELSIAYYFMKDSVYRPYVAFRVGYMNYQKDFREQWALGEKNAPSNSIAVGMAFERGERGEVMLFIEPNYYATYAEETYYYWTVNFGISWNIGG